MTGTASDGDHDMRSHRDKAAVENALFLLDEAQLSMEHVARRLGLTVSGLEMKMRRAGVERYSGSSKGAGEASGSRKVSEVRRPST